jgi:hypothetical protein
VEKKLVEKECLKIDATSIVHMASSFGPTILKLHYIFDFDFLEFLEFSGNFER